MREWLPECLADHSLIGRRLWIGGGGGGGG